MKRLIFILVSFIAVESKSQYIQGTTIYFGTTGIIEIDTQKVLLLMSDTSCFYVYFRDGDETRTTADIPTTGEKVCIYKTETIWNYGYKITDYVTYENDYVRYLDKDMHPFDKKYIIWQSINRRVW